jgi:DNA (cytosine-5)-methyltransferase 1
MIYGSVCSGIEAASVAWHPLGWRAAFLSEIEKFPRAVLAHHFPRVPLHGDFTTIEAGQYEPIDVLVGGTPCQSFSIAGLRGGMDDARGNLALEYLRLADRLRPRWIVWENVPGVLSSNGGRDFGSFLGGMVKIGYGVAFRVLDAQFFGLAQRRERVFVVGYLGDWRRAAAVLQEPQSLRGHPAPRREAGKSVASTLAARTNGGGGLGTDFDCDGGLLAFVCNNTSGPIDIAGALNACETSSGRNDFATETFIAHTVTTRPGGKDAGPAGLITATLTSNGDSHRGFRLADGLVPISVAMRGREGGSAIELGDDVAFTVRASQGGGDKPHVLTHAVRQLTPRECERLQGFPDDYTRIPMRRMKREPSAKALEKFADYFERGADGVWTQFAADGARYKALGNSMAVPCMAWIGRRIAHVDAAIRSIAA